MTCKLDQIEFAGLNAMWPWAFIMGVTSFAVCPECPYHFRCEDDSVLKTDMFTGAACTDHECGLDGNDECT